jgi:hypothetical protein
MNFALTKLFKVCAIEEKLFELKLGIYNYVGSNAVLVCLGVAPGFYSAFQPLIDPAAPYIYSAAQPIIDRAAVKNKKTVKHMAVVTSIGVGDSYQDCNMFTTLFVNIFISKPITEKNIQEEMLKRDLQDSGISWTLVRPGCLTNGKMTGKCQFQERGIGGGLIPRADVAHFILTRCLDNEETRNKAFTIVSE